MNRSFRPARAPRATRRWVASTTALSAASAALVVAGPTAPAVSAPDPDCPAAFPVADLAAGQPVNGLTVTSGTVPDPFTGEVIGVLENGVGPGRDMIMVDLTSAEIDRVGVWMGMSGSPVYAADGRLIGAVAFGLAGSSPVAGLTPAADMHNLLATPPEVAAAKDQVRIPRRLGERLVEEDLATRGQVKAGMSRLDLPLMINGLAAKRLDKVARKLDLDFEGFRTGSSGGTASLGISDLVPGGNVAAAISHGDITWAGTGTIAAVCGGELIGFGHPMLWNGPSTMSLHAASALYIQEDFGFAGFKVANIDPTPLGTITEDRMAGILGVTGDVPRAAEVTSAVSGEGRPARDGTTSVSLEDWVPDVAFVHLLSNHDIQLDGVGKGVGDQSWTVTGTREDGSPFELSREDVFASKWDISWESAWDLLLVLYLLQENGVEDIRIDGVDITSDLTRDFDRLAIKQVEVKQKGLPWMKVSRREPLFLLAKPAKFRVTMRSAADKSTVRRSQRVEIPGKASGRSGRLSIFGGGWDDEFLWAGAKTFDGLLEQIEGAPSNDDVVVQMKIRRLKKHAVDERKATGTVVTGGLNVPVFFG